MELEECIGILEVKTVGEGGRPNRDRWADQVQWQMLVTNMPAGVIAEARIDDVTDTFICDADAFGGSVAVLSKPARGGRGGYDADGQRQNQPDRRAFLYGQSNKF